MRCKVSTSNTPLHLAFSHDSDEKSYNSFHDVFVRYKIYETSDDECAKILLPEKYIPYFFNKLSYTPQTLKFFCLLLSKLSLKTLEWIFLQNFAEFTETYIQVDYVSKGTFERARGR